MRVDFPRPDSPMDRTGPTSQVMGQPASLEAHHQALSKPPRPATMSVKSNPFLTDLRCSWLGRAAKPTYSLSCWWGVDSMRLLGVASRVSSIT